MTPIKNNSATGPIMNKVSINELTKIPFKALVIQGI